MRRPQWFELIPGYECNNRCQGCYALAGAQPGFSSLEAIAELRFARSLGATRLWLGGGEPTLRADLPQLINAARKLNFSSIKLQTNGMRLAYEAYTSRLKALGLTEVNFSIKSHIQAKHDALSQTPGCFELLQAGIAASERAGLELAADILVYADTIADLPTLVPFYFSRGIKQFNLWSFTSVEGGAEGTPQKMPRLSELARAVEACLNLGLSEEPNFIQALHLPPCALSGAAQASAFYPKELDLYISNPGGYRFWLEESPMEGGHYPQECEGCSLRSRCPGVRKNYIEHYGSTELKPL